MKELPFLQRPREPWPMKALYTCSPIAPEPSGWSESHVPFHLSPFLTFAFKYVCAARSTCFLVFRSAPVPSEALSHKKAWLRDPLGRSRSHRSRRYPQERSI